MGIREQDICTEVQYSLTNVTEHENKSAIVGSIILKTDTQCETGFATMSIHFLVLDTSLDYAILGSLELENCQSIICMACKSITSILPYKGTFQWMSLTTYVSLSLQDASTTVCTHTNSSKKSLKNSMKVSNLQNEFYKTINQTSVSFEDPPFYLGPQSELPGLHSEPSSEQYLDDMDESIHVPNNLILNT